jgi:hypothetical protein
LQEKKILEESIGVKERKLVELEQKLPDYKWLSQIYSCQSLMIF